MTALEIATLLKITVGLFEILETHGVSRDDIDGAIKAENERKKILLAALDE